MKNINPDAPVKCTKSIEIKAPAEKVWKTLTDINQWSAWQTEIHKPQINGALQPLTTFDWTTGGVRIHSTLHTVEPYTHFGWTGKTLGMYAIHNWTLNATHNGTIVQVDESMEGFLTRLFKKSFNQNLEKGMVKWLDLLKAECEKKQA